ncbi:EamA domain-containing membrane protein RarD [Salsuginibacillus halophilus]|uniref:EamA domain-containing membrane protein RarD n=1 Tax=Salsuginibacillus halophilus TaxID=517424 RepID=A0A2P8HW00_9BACI|nr:DMT family transporter [Salsuginibacillus halophilus]PSL50412.1 EamA domain-containing membrane protein RarD [Salsuginibacillus halophilus]
MWKYYIFLIVVVMMFSGNLVVGKYVNELPATTVALIRNLIAFFVILPFGYQQIKQQWPSFKHNWVPLMGYAITGITTFNVLVYLSLNYTSSTNAGIVEATTPVFAMILGYIFLKERLTRKQVLGVFISLIGAVWVMVEGSLTVLVNLAVNRGDFIMLMAVISWAFYTLLIQQHNHKFPLLGAMVVMLFFGNLLLIPFVFVGWSSGLPEGLFQPELIAGLLYLGIFPSVVALMLWTRAVAAVGPSKASVFLNLLPVFTMIGAVLFLGEAITAAQIVGGAIAVSGVILAMRQ